MAEKARRRLRSSTVVLGGMGALAAALTSCGSEPDKRCVDPKSYDVAKGGSLRPYWDESAYYPFSLAEVEALEDVVAELHEMCLTAAGHIVDRDRFADLGITDARLAGLVAESWRRRDELPSVHGRFDLRYDGRGPATMLEYNADTPTSLVEAASAQWFWMEDRFPGYARFLPHVIR
ncbi:hypothetical protein GCM10010319_04330 [Streptomyces blastmyceticus]|uniref:Glutathionylspermidine synthase pre-ATP-grasp-like domain-containing protein n=1 Tax=Streptomyces blastmyceticus TaxID=68180 RepID=A0ABN0WB52_9ACTN